MRQTIKKANFILKRLDSLTTRLHIFVLKILFKSRVKVAKNARFSGVPAILALAGPITIGENARLSSRLLSNVLGINHRVIISTIESGRIIIGDNFHISGGSIISRKSITIGNNVFIGANCLITDSDHHEENFIRRRLGHHEQIKSKDVVIGDDVWLGANVIVLKGAKIGSRSIIGAGLTVRGVIPDDTIVGRIINE